MNQNDGSFSSKSKPAKTDAIVTGEIEAENIYDRAKKILSNQLMVLLQQQILRLQQMFYL